MENNIIPCAEGDDEFIAEQLNAVTDSMIAFDDAAEDELVVFKVTDSHGSIIAGCNLLIDYWRVADLDILWVAEEYRGRGVGSALLRAAERVAAERGCKYIKLGTFDFQAQPLYEKNGYAVCGVLEDCPAPGHTHYDMIKQLEGATAAAETACACDIRPGSEEDAEFIDDSLCEYNWSQVPFIHEFEPIGKKIVDVDGNLIAGCFAGVNFWNIAFVDMLWVDGSRRGQGLGESLLSAVEREAKEIGTGIIMLDAREWNVDFFKKLGYTVYCVIEDYPEGHSVYKLQKRL